MKRASNPQAQQTRARWAPILTPGVLGMVTLAQVVGAAPLLARKLRRWMRRRDSYEWSMSRWKGDWTQAPSPAWRSKSGPHLSFYADGFAETRLATQLASALAQQRPEWRFSLVIRNLRDADEGHAIPPDLPVSVLPFDFFPAVARWFATVQPDGVILIEKLFYPLFVRGCAGLGARVVGVNSYTRASDCRKNPRFKAWILHGFSALGVRSPQQTELLQPLLGTPKQQPLCQVTGSLKFPAPRAVAHETSRPDLQKWLDLARERPLIAAGSVEEGEVEVLLAAFAALRARCDAVLVWAPRHLENADELTSQLQLHGWKVARRSQARAAHQSGVATQDELMPDVLLLDTMGELWATYARCEVAFVGGTFAGGGHNILEPLGHGIPVVFGPRRGFFAAEQEMCEAHRVGVAVADADQLAEQWHTLIEDQDSRREMRERIATFVENGQQSWKVTLDFLLAQFSQK